MIIDIHTHTFPDKIAFSVSEKLSRQAHIIPHTHARNDELRASMREAGIGLSVVLPVATTAGQVEKLNQFAASMNEQAKESGLLYFGTMHPDYEDYRDELARLCETGIQGIKIHPVYQGADLDDIRFLRIMECAAEMGLIVITHGGLDIGFPGVVRCTPAMCRHVVEEIGSFPLIAAHMGGWRNWEEVPEYLAGTGIYLDTSFSAGAITPLPDGYWDDKDQKLLSEEEFVSLVHAVGAERVLFGTDSPWASQKDTVQKILAMDLTGEEREAIFFRNAGRLLGIC